MKKSRIIESQTGGNLKEGELGARVGDPCSKHGTTTVGAVDIQTQAGNLNLESNPFYREFTTAIALSNTAKGLPEMQGSGWVRELLPDFYCKFDSCSRNAYEGYRHKRLMKFCDVRRMSRQASGGLLSFC